MNSVLMSKKYQKNLLAGFLSLLMMAGLLTILVANGYLFAADMDDQIESAARKTYVFKTFLAGDDIQINSQDGIVTLTGTVAVEPHSFLATETVLDLPGVKSVDNRLEVRGGIPKNKSDAWLQMMVKNMLLLHRNPLYDDTVVDVKDGMVTLHGMAGSQAEKELAAEYVKDVDGVMGVSNKMTVAAAPKKQRRTVEEFIDDSSIKAQIKLALAFHRGTSPFRAVVTVSRGVVTVSGMAKNAAEKKLVAKRIEDIRGVVRIDNRMIIE
jgi:osmotically-inducible protein OsmY